MDCGGVASDDGGASFQLATYDSTPSVAWWQGSSGSWLLFTALGRGANAVTAFGTGPARRARSASQGTGGNVSGSSAAALAAPADGGVGSLVGVPGQDMAFVSGARRFRRRETETGVVRRVAVGPGPAFSHVTRIGDGVITKPAALGLLPNRRIGELAPRRAARDRRQRYLERGALPRHRCHDRQPDRYQGHGSGRWRGQVASLQQRFPISADCASGTVIAASGNPADGLLKSTDGGQSYTKLPAIRPSEDIRAAAITPGSPSSMIVGDSDGYILSSSDGGSTWTVVNDPTTA